MKKQSKLGSLIALMGGIAIIIFSMLSFSINPGIDDILSIGGGIFLIGFGAYTLWIKK